MTPIAMAKANHATTAARLTTLPQL